MIKIEKGIPMPESRGDKPTPFDDMQVGDSFIWPHSQFRAPASLTRKGWKFSVRSARKETGHSTYTRVWRIA